MDVTYFVPETSGTDPYDADPYRTEPRPVAPGSDPYVPGSNPYAAGPRPSRFDWSASAAQIPTSRTPYTGAPTAAPYGHGGTPPWEQPVAAGPSYGPTSAVHWLLPVGRSWQSIAAGYLGIVGLFIPVFAPFAIWLGIVALQRARTGGHGRGRAIFGIVAGAIGLTWGVLALIGALL